MGKTRLLLVEDHALVGEGLRALLATEFVVCDLVRDGREVLAAVARHSPDILILDLSLPGRNGLDLLPDIRRQRPETRVLVVTMHTDQFLAQSAFALGAMGFMPKDSDVKELRAAIAQVQAGKRYLSPRIPQAPGHPVTSPTMQALFRLTPRQQEIVRAVGHGRTTEEISDMLGLSVHTIHYHRRNIRRILGIDTDDGLLRFALQALVADHADQMDAPVPGSPERSRS